MNRTRLFISIVILVCSMPASARNYTDSDGVTYSSSLNDDGAVLKSESAKLYLGKSCDAYSPQFGKGTWGWANGGVAVELNGRRIGFPRQESPFEDLRCRF